MRPAASTLAAFALLASCGAPAGDEAANQSVLIDADTARAGMNEFAAPPEAVANKAEPASYEAELIPAAFRGDYDQDKEACGKPSEYRLTVSPTELRFHESIGTVRKVQVEAPDRIEVLTDYQGEGESWQNVRKVQLDGDRLTISGDGIEIVRLRCPARPEKAPAAG